MVFMGAPAFQPAWRRPHGLYGRAGFPAGIGDARMGISPKAPTNQRHKLALSTVPWELDRLIRRIKSAAGGLKAGKIFGAHLCFDLAIHIMLSQIATGAIISA